MVEVGEANKEVQVMIQLDVDNGFSEGDSG